MIGEVWQVGGNADERLVTNRRTVVRAIAHAVRDIFSPARSFKLNETSRKTVHILEWIERSIPNRSRYDGGSLSILTERGRIEHPPSLSRASEMVIEHFGVQRILRPTVRMEDWDRLDPRPWPGFGVRTNLQHRFSDDWSVLNLDRVELATWEAAAYLALDENP